MGKAGSPASRLSAADSAFADQDHGDIVRAAAIKGGEDQLIDAFLGGQFRSRQQRADFRIADLLGQAIATQQDLHAGAEVPAHQFHAQ